MILLLIGIPLAGLAAAWIFPSAIRQTALTATFLNLILSFTLAWRILHENVIAFAPGPRAAEAGLVFGADGLSALFLATMSFAGAGVVLFAWSHSWKEGAPGRLPPPVLFWRLWLLMLVGMNGVILSKNLLGLFVCLEILGAAAVGMVTLGGDRHTFVLARRYFFIRTPGSMAFFFGLALLYSIYGTLNFAELREVMLPSPLISWAAVLMLVGLFIKSAIFPLHYWLAPTHARAFGPAGVVLSAIVVKGPFYAALRLWFDLFPSVTTVTVAQLIGVLGSIGIIWGAFRAMRERHLKMIIAHSTVSQMGYLFLLFPLLTGAAGAAWTWPALTGGVYQALSHTLAKAALLMAAGVIIHATGSDKLREMHGIAGRMPLITLTIVLSCVSLIGLPPSGGFIGKWLLLSAAFESGQWWWTPVLALGGLLTAGYAFLLISYAFQSKGKAPVVRRPPALMQTSALVLAIASVVIGLRVQEPLRLLQEPGAAVMERQREP